MQTATVRMGTTGYSGTLKGRSSSGSRRLSTMSEIATTLNATRVPNETLSHR